MGIETTIEEGERIRENKRERERARETQGKDEFKGQLAIEKEGEEGE